jgi:hypothetical protein
MSMPPGAIEAAGASHSYADRRAKDRASPIWEMPFLLAELKLLIRGFAARRRTSVEVNTYL